ncbi:MAG: arginase family protein [bacterium]|nr:arginase family protein [bacterium]
MGLVKIIGAPFSVGCRVETSTAIDQQNGPLSIRAALRSLTANFDVPLGFEDLGDLSVKKNTVEDVLKALEDQVTAVITKGDVPLVLGGAHTITLGTLRALSKAKPGFSVIYIDAHPDIMPHATVNYGSGIFYALKEEVIRPDKLAFIGLRQVENPEYRLLRENNIFHVHASEIEGLGIANVVKEIKDRFPAPYFISLDLDAIDPAFAPGVTLPYPCGLSPREVMYILEELSRQGIVGFEIAELSPINDRNDETAMIAASLILKVCGVLSSKQRTH